MMTFTVPTLVYPGASGSAVVLSIVVAITDLSLGFLALRFLSIGSG